MITNSAILAYLLNIQKDIDYLKELIEKLKEVEENA